MNQASPQGEQAAAQQMLGEASEAQWIMAPEGFDALPLFRKTFKLHQPVRRAMVACCGLGHFELWINGVRVGEDVLQPAWTQYTKRCCYVMQDVTALLTKGENVAAVWLGNGMYHVEGKGRYRKFTGSFGPLKLIWQLDIEQADGTSVRIVSDRTWKTAPGPIVFSSIYGGEDYDARREPKGWMQAGFDDAAWQPAQQTVGPGGRLVLQESPPLRVMQRYQPVAIHEPQPGVRVYDLGQNFAGWPAITMQGVAGATVKLITGELLDESGRVTQKNTGSPVYFTYTTRSRGLEQWQPRFAYTGFRYVQAEGDLDALASLQGQFIHASVPVAGGFACSSDLFNRIHEIILNAIRSNLQHVLTDCPHREKFGWLEQAHLMGPALLYNFDALGFYRKILADMRDAQHENGCVPTTAPQYTVFPPPWGEVFNDSPEWGSAIVLCPWMVYQFTGDRTILEENYDAMVRYVNYLASRAEEHIITYGLGDWYDIGPGAPGLSKLTSPGVTATAIYHADLVALAKAAKVLERESDAAHYAQRAAAVCEAFNRRFFNLASRQYDTGSQTANAMPLALGLVKAEHRPDVLAALIHDITHHNHQVTAGDIGFRFVLEALAQAGRSDVIHDMLRQRQGPGYAWQIERGATTLSEAWDANPRVSQNHLMLGHAEIWFYRYLAGICVDLSREGAQQIVINPAVTGDLTWVCATYDSVLGRIESRWERTDDQVILNVTIPDGAGARIYVPGVDTACDVGPGTHHFTSTLTLAAAR